ncbi:MAG: ABC transporter ATP-binding protein [Thermoanaerobaculia bacterium]|nr:MAG: ABC transporter ATP-binding protein [Thermoanaerobaculia bacterium]
MTALLEIRDLVVAFPGGDGVEVPVVRGLSLEVARGEIVGLVGESGSGKSVTSLAVLGLVPPPGRIASGSIRLDGRELVGLPESELRRLRGRRVGLVFQEPAAALNPVLTVGHQLVEAIRAHRRIRAADARRRAAELLARLALPEPERRLRDYPHQLSGGQRQRVLLAIALAAGPDLLIADEPTTALDVTVQAQALELLAELRRDLGLSVLLITHDLAVVAGSCDRGAVVYAGRVVEEGSVRDLFGAPLHPYSRGLLASVPRLGHPAARGELPSIPGQVPSPASLPPGCPFHPRCTERLPECSAQDPSRREVAPGRAARCVRVGEETPR